MFDNTFNKETPTTIKMRLIVSDYNYHDLIVDFQCFSVFATSEFEYSYLLFTPLIGEREKKDKNTY